MDKKKQTDDPALVYAKEIFRDSMGRLPDREKNMPAELTKHRCILFEQSCVSFQLVHDRNYDFSNVEKK